MSKLFDLSNEEENIVSRELLDIAIESLDHDTAIKSDMIISNTFTMLDALKKLSNENITIDSPETLLTYNLCVESLGLKTVNELNADILEKTISTVENGLDKYLSNEGFFDDVLNTFKTTTTILKELKEKIKKSDTDIDVSTSALDKLKSSFLKYGDFDKEYDFSKLSVALINELYTNIDYSESFSILEHNLKKYVSADKVKVNKISFEDPTKIKNKRLKKLIEAGKSELKNDDYVYLLAAYYKTVSIFNVNDLTDKLVNSLFNNMTIKILVAEDKDNFLAGTSLFNLLIDKFKSPKIVNNANTQLTKADLLKIIDILEDSVKYSTDLAKNYKSKIYSLKANTDAKSFASGMHRQSLTDHNDFRKSLISFINKIVK